MLSVILPTYNEAENVKLYLPLLQSVLERSETINQEGYEILIIDDNSPDKTWKYAEEASRKNRKIRVFRRIGERGLGSAILFGIGVTSGDWVLVMDADFQHDENQIPAMLELAKRENLDLVVGSRYSGNFGAMNCFRKFLSQTANRIGKWILEVPVQDSLSGFFLLKREALLPYLEKLNPKGFKILLEIVCRVPGLKIQEIPYKFRERKFGKTKLSTAVATDYLLSLFEIRFGIRFSPYFVKYGIVGAMGIFVNIFSQYIFDRIIQTGLYKIEIDFPNPYFFVKPGIAVILGFEVSLLHNFFWNHFWTFSDQNEIWYRALAKFHFVSIFSFLIQISVWFYLYSFFIEKGYLGDKATYVSNFLGILFAFVSNYFLNRNLTWKRQP